LMRRPIRNTTNSPCMLDVRRSVLIMIFPLNNGCEPRDSAPAGFDSRYIFNSCLRR
jgi:hypothetical protein